MCLSEVKCIKKQSKADQRNEDVLHSVYDRVKQSV
jgi:hypothetical protein